MKFFQIDLKFPLKNFIKKQQKYYKKIKKKQIKIKK